jgi:SAM-dependent methyltransferase
MDRPEDFWDRRFAERGFAYGTEPNDFVREMAGRVPAGRVLCLADGQGRNAVHLAGVGFAVTMMDRSAVGIARAEALARERGTRIETVVADLASFAIEPGAWQGIVSVFVHLPRPLRERVARAVVAGLSPGGALVLEAYGPRQPGFGTGGPEDPDQLPGVDTLTAELAGLEFEIAREVERDVIEGHYHTGRASTVQLLGRRPRS